MQINQTVITQYFESRQGATMFHKYLVIIFLSLILSIIGGCNSLSETQKVTIIRDTYGTPHIYADTHYGLFYGYGYAISQDRLFQLEMAKRSAQGNVAQVMGQAYLPLDIKIREHYNPHTIHAAMLKLSQADSAIFKGYADGINQWIVKINRSPDTLMPKQFIDHQFTPTTWTEFDVIMVFVGSMINRFGDYNTELDNQQLLMALMNKHGSNKANEIFNMLLPHMSKDAIDTIAPGEWSVTGRDRYKTELVNRLEGKNTASSPLLTAKIQPTVSTSGRHGTLRWQGFNEAPFSNILILGKNKLKDAEAVLINGPQFGFYRPAYTYSVGLHGAGYNAVGNSPAGYPLIQFGHNDHISWGSTWGAGDNVDIFQLTLDPQDSKKYLYKGLYIPFEQEKQIIKVKNQPDKSITVYRSVYGPVIKYQAKQGIAYAKKRGWAGKELSTLLSWNKVSKAQNYQQWADYVAESAINVNWYYVDQSGNIGYTLGGFYPVRRPGFDGRTPTPGDGSADWLGLYPFHTNPHVLNPISGYIANWNNRPAAGFPNPDQWWYNWNTIDRALELTTQVDANSTLSPKAAWEVMKHAAFVDPNARHFVPSLISLAQNSNVPLHRQAANILTHWDYSNTDNNNDGKYDNPGSTLFRAWLKEALRITYSAVIPDSHLHWFTNPGYGNKDKLMTNSYNISIGTKVLNTIWTNSSLFNHQDSNKIQLDSLTAAIKTLTLQYGENNQTWLENVDTLRFNNKNYIGVPQANDDETLDTPIALNRGTENNMTVFYTNKVAAYEVVAPGQSGFIDPHGLKAKHYNDQYKNFINFHLKPVSNEYDNLKIDSTDKTVLVIPLSGSVKPSQRNESQ
ncbi:penicillin amidase [Shewanella sp. YLB-07]|nr:penicillin amidase [Shewanella sp. YLB-07]